MNKVYKIITDQIVKKLESGIIPWHRPWNGGEPAMNLITKKPYHGINVFLLACSGYTSPYWLTFKQVQKLGGHVKKGEKSTIITFWSVKQKEKNNESEETKTETYAVLRYYRVFNVEQCEGLDGKVPEPKIRDFQPIDEAERIVKAMPKAPAITHKEQRAYYSPMRDYVNMPLQGTFISDEEYYSALFHELTHSTGHESRLGRKSLTTLAGFGSHEYSKEELIAEMGSAYLCGHCGISQRVIDNQAAYIQGWLGRLRKDPKMVVWTASQAQKAADYILAV